MKKFFFQGRKPSHKDNQHFLIPDLVDPFISERMHNLGKQVHLISDLLFERLVQDVYDEVFFNFLKNLFCFLKIG